jgi:C_GCAxxG_C_C family probable redox protein
MSLPSRIDPTAVAEQAAHNFVEDSYNCAEAVVAAFSVARGEAPRSLTGLVSGFGGGVGGLGRMCGAVAGGLVVLGREAAELGLDRAAVRSLSRDLHEQFERTFGSTACSVLSAHDCEDGSAAPFDLRRCGAYLRHVAGHAAQRLDDARAAACERGTA